MTKRLLEVTPDLGCPVCSQRHRPGTDCNGWPYMPVPESYPFAPPDPKPKAKKTNLRGKRKKRGPEQDRAHKAPEHDRTR